MDNNFDIWIGTKQNLHRAADNCDKMLCLIHKQNDPEDKWGMLNPEQDPEVLLSVAAFLYDHAAKKLRVPARTWGKQPTQKRLPDEKGTITIPVPKPGSVEPIVPE